MAKLVMNPTSGAKKEIPLASRILSIGRDPSNDLVLSDAMVSRRHAVLERRGEQYVIRDNGSSNGTVVNGDRVTDEQPLRDGDLVAIGSARLLFQMEQEGSPAAAPPDRRLLATQPMPVSLPEGSAPRTSCASCGAEPAGVDTFCRQCGKRLPNAPERPVPLEQRSTCTSCGASVVLPAKFCGACGKVLLSEVQSPRRTSSRPGRPSDSSSDSPDPSRREGHRSSRARDVGGEPGPEAGNGASSLRVSGSPMPEAAPLRSAAVIRPVGPLARQSRRPSMGGLPVSVRPAGFWIRMIAYVIDTFIVSLPLFAGIAAWTTVLRQPPPPLEIPLSLGTWIVPVSAALVTLLLAFVYPVYFWGRRGATPGKRALGLAVVTIEGEVPIGYRRAVIRIMGYVINGLLLGTGFLLIAVSEDKRGLHDRLAETCVVKRA